MKWKIKTKIFYQRHADWRRVHITINDCKFVTKVVNLSQVSDYPLEQDIITIILTKLNISKLKFKIVNKKRYQTAWF